MTEKMMQKKKIKMDIFDKCTLHKKIFPKWMTKTEDREKKAKIYTKVHLREKTCDYDKIQNIALSSHQSQLEIASPEIASPSSPATTFHGKENTDPSSLSRPQQAIVETSTRVQTVIEILKEIGRIDSQRGLERNMNIESPTRTSTLVSSAIKLLLNGEHMETDENHHPVCQTNIPNPELANNNGTAGQNSAQSQQGAALPHCMSPGDMPSYGQGRTLAPLRDHPGGTPTARELCSGAGIRKEREDKDSTAPQTVLQCPMLEAPNPHGNVMMIERLWSPEDLTQYATMLKSPSEVGGTRWTKELKDFCQTYRPTMRELLNICAKNMDASKMQQILNATQVYHDERPVRVRYDDNRRYITAVDTLCEKILTLFPTVFKLDEVRNCKQDRDETVSQFRHRIEQTMLTHGGGADENNPFTKAFLASQFMNNMRTDLSKSVRQTLIGYKLADIEDIMRHAIHAEEMHNDEREQEKKLEKEKAVTLQLVMIDAVTKLASEKKENKENDKTRYGKRDYNGRKQFNHGCCFICNGADHWRFSCPELRKNRDLRERKGDRPTGLDWNHGRCFNCNSEKHWRPSCDKPRRQRGSASQGSNHQPGGTMGPKVLQLRRRPDQTRHQAACPRSSRWRPMQDSATQPSALRRTLSKRWRPGAQQYDDADYTPARF